MKRTISFIALLMTLVMLLSACTEQPKNPDATEGTTTAPTQGTTTGTEPEATMPTEAEEKTPTELNTAEDFEKFIKDNRWYYRALGCVFEKPQEIPAYFYFYGGVGDYTQATGDELAFILDAYKKKNPDVENQDYAYNYVRMPAAKINEALSILGVTIENVKIPDQWVYYDKTDSYYFWVSDAYGVGRWSVTKVEKGTEGIVAVYWKMDGIDNGEPSIEIPSKGAKMVLTMQMQSDGTYRVLSNVPQK